MARPLLNEEKHAWRWLRRELSRELGVNFRNGGKQPTFDAETEFAIVNRVTSAPPKSRRIVYEMLARAHGVSEKTIQRIALEVLRFQDSGSGPMISV